MRPPDDGCEEILVRDEDSLNMHRFYNVSVERDLFGVSVFLVRWGRQRKPGRIRIDASGSRSEMRRKLVELASRKILRGYRRLEVRTAQTQQSALPLFETR
ncbi:WGR domain-containing protein [uncultured Jannaschia sp.]|uniref:WGR domain-containing protein n=1 Tax=uncultured Jannaschia sp. TaxID=293347 RepID=UPI0026366BED|nr:WGR domain-containing protein [uncultured Jannaschia sp.]